LLCLHSRRLPAVSVAVANDLDQIILEKYPAAAHLGAANLPAAGSFPQRLRMDVQELGGGL